MIRRHLAVLVACAALVVGGASIGDAGVARAASSGSGHAMAEGTTAPTTTSRAPTSTARRVPTTKKRKATTTVKRSVVSRGPAVTPALRTAGSPAPVTATPTTLVPATTAPSTLPPVPTTMVTPQGVNWTLTWSDEFTNGLNPAWNVVTTGGGVFDDVFGDECYQAGQVSVADGLLSLTAAARATTCRGVTKPYVSGLVTTRNKFSQTYGRFEARMKLPVVRGTWPAWWLMPAKPTFGEWPASGEIDVMEYVGDWPDVVYQTIHWGDNGVHLQDASAWHVTGTTAEWHTYALEWQRGELRWYVDDALVKTYNPPAGGAQFEQPFYLILNQAVGGNWPGQPNVAELPSTVSVDWVRVYQRTA